MNVREIKKRLNYQYIRLNVVLQHALMIDEEMHPLLQRAGLQLTQQHLEKVIEKLSKINKELIKELKNNG